MLFCDVNILIHAIKPDQDTDSPTIKRWLDARIVDDEPVGVSELVLSAMTRIVTHHRIYENPLTPTQCMQFADALLGAPSVEVLRPGPRHWPIFRDLVTTHRLRGNDVPDAYLAALALEQGATLVTLDRGFGRFERLRVLNPLDAND